MVVTDYQPFNPKNLQANLQADVSNWLKNPHFGAILQAILDIFGHFFALLDGCVFFLNGSKRPFIIKNADNRRFVHSDYQRFTGGVRGIRTPETLLTSTRFPGVPLQPLEHHSICACALGNAKLPLRHKCECKDSEILLDCSKIFINL